MNNTELDCEETGIHINSIKCERYDAEPKFESDEEATRWLQDNLSKLVRAHKALAECRACLDMATSIIENEYPESDDRRQEAAHFRNLLERLG
jgi:hypothetical protein